MASIAGPASDAAATTFGHEDTAEVALRTKPLGSGHATTSGNFGSTSGAPADAAATTFSHKNTTEVAIDSVRKTVRFHTATGESEYEASKEAPKNMTTPTLAEARPLRSCLKRKRELDPNDATVTSRTILPPPSPPPRTPNPKSFEEWESVRSVKWEGEEARSTPPPRPTLAEQTGPFISLSLASTAEWTEKKALQEGWAKYEASRRVADQEHHKNEVEKDRLIILRHKLAMERWAYERRMYQSFRGTGRVITETEVSVLVSAFATTNQDVGNKEVEKGWKAYATAKIGRAHV